MNAPDAAPGYRALRRYRAGHFEFYVGDAFEEIVADQVEFLARRLL